MWYWSKTLLQEVVQGEKLKSWRKGKNRWGREKGRQLNETVRHEKRKDVNMNITDVQALSLSVTWVQAKEKTDAMDLNLLRNMTNRWRYVIGSKRTVYHFEMYRAPAIWKLCKLLDMMKPKELKYINYCLWKTAVCLSFLMALLETTIEHIKYDVQYSQNIRRPPFCTVCRMVLHVVAPTAWLSTILHNVGVRLAYSNCFMVPGISLSWFVNEATRCKRKAENTGYIWIFDIPPSQSRMTPYFWIALALS